MFGFKRKPVLNVVASKVIDIIEEYKRPGSGNGHVDHGKPLSDYLDDTAWNEIAYQIGQDLGITPELPESSVTVMDFAASVVKAAESGKKTKSY